MSEKLWDKYVLWLETEAVSCKMVDPEKAEDREAFTIWLGKLSDDIRKEVTEEILKDHFAMGEDIQVWNDMTKKWKDTTVWYNTAGCGADKPVVRRIPEPRPMTDEELVKSLIDAGVTYLGMFSRLTHEAMAKDLGIPTEVTE